MVFGCIAQSKCFGDDRRVFSCSIKMAAVRAENTGVREVSLSFDVSGRQRPTKSSVTFGMKVGVMCNSGADVQFLKWRPPWGDAHFCALMCVKPPLVIYCRVL